MWLLDANLDIHLVELLNALEIECETAESRGWKALRNGELVAAAAAAGFDTLLTRDQLFAESASRS
jgi:predicted nuclease of predicted toxin-antitoxin system